MNFVDFDQVTPYFRGMRVAVVGSAPSVLSNEPGFIDSHDVVVRANNFKLGKNAGMRTDVFYSFFGTSILKTREELIECGVRLCMCKCPNSKPIDSDWHRLNGLMRGVDFRFIYTLRRHFWFCDTYVPDDDSFMRKFELLGRHIPTTGFAALLDVLAHRPESVYVTGFDFFSSGVHNVNEKWKPGRSDDPIGHRPDLELEWLRDNHNCHPLLFDERLQSLVIHNERMIA